ncbi:hypothetical protein LTR37_017255 [Vermiconidia calcicola]|uniref:Uncharacterized protein n=1 Tax=Vermiconidia calcicola TaxID=1690605 RepID=A0ACC3MM54_9PEZI|nr:hypothetical protein LTR37_017255 [Vermiconidia calcicola]
MSKKSTIRTFEVFYIRFTSFGIGSRKDTYGKSYSIRLAMDLEDDGKAFENSTTSASGVVDDLIARAKTVLSELETLRNRLRELRQEGTVEIAHFRSTVQSELGMLERLSQKPEGESTNHVARSSNLPFLETVWNIAKNSNDLQALLKRVYLESNSILRSQGMHPKRLNNDRRKKKGGKSEAVTIDAITDAGRTWTKVSLVTNTRLLFDLAKQGWDSGGSDDDTYGPSLHDDEDDDGDVPLVKTAKELTKAAKMFRIRTKQPSVRLVLPRIQAGETPEIDVIIDDCKRTGASVICGEDSKPLMALEESLRLMAPDPITSFSDTLNIDCTILLAIVSEFSHAKVSKEPWFHTALQRQVEIEDNENLLPSLLYPALGRHELVCTQEAAKRMREIVENIGTPSEKARTAILMGDDRSKASEQLIADLQDWSAYEVPPHLKLPIHVVDQNEDNCQSNLPSQAHAASADMTSINKSVFLYGWTTGRTTITSNRTVVKQIENELDKYEDLDDSVWLKIWLCPTARSLVGKEKRGAAQKEEKGWRLPDPLRREEQRRNGLDVLSTRNGYEVEDLRPNGYPCEDVLAAKMAALR